MQHNDRDALIDINFRFLSWLSKNFPEIKNSIEMDGYSGFGEYIRKYPTSFWGDIGDRPFSYFSIKSTSEETILEKIAWYVNNSRPNVAGEILVGFVEGHMFKRPDSPLAKELGEMIGRDLSGLC